MDYLLCWKSKAWHSTSKMIIHFSQAVWTLSLRARSFAATIDDLPIWWEKKPQIKFPLLSLKTPSHAKAVGIEGTICVQFVSLNARFGPSHWMWNWNLLFVRFGAVGVPFPSTTDDISWNKEFGWRSIAVQCSSSTLHFTSWYHIALAHLIITGNNSAGSTVQKIIIPLRWPNKMHFQNKFWNGCNWKVLPSRIKLLRAFVGSIDPSFCFPKARS